MMRCPPWTSLLLCALTSAAPACAHISETVQLRAVPSGPVTIARVETGSALAIRGTRDGARVRAEVEVVHLCADEQRQRARGFRVSERKAEGSSLALEWLFGGLFAAAGAGLAAWNTVSPPDSSAGSLRSQSRGYAFAGGIGAVGLALLGGALYQQLSLGRSETDLGERELTQRGRETICRREPAHEGTARLTLSDGTQIEGAVDLHGDAVLALPDDVDARMDKEGNRRATLEVLGDARAQARISL